MILDKISGLKFSHWLATKMFASDSLVYNGLGDVMRWEVLFYQPNRI
jgi:hypothetical protein